MIQKTQSKQEAQNPLILRCHRLIDAFTKSDDERDFYLDRLEGFIVYVDLEKSESDIKELDKEITNTLSRYCLIPKLTFYETKKIMEGFVNEKVYDIDTKEKLLDIIQSKEARENFLEFIYDHHAENEKWQQYYQERSRVRIIEWLRNNQFNFVFEEDLDMTKEIIEKLKMTLFQPKVGKDILAARKALLSRSKAYYSSEALNPRPKRGRPPKQIVKQEFEPKVTMDIYTTVPPAIRPFLFTPDFASPSAVTFSSRFENEEQMMSRRLNTLHDVEANPENLNQKLAALRSLSTRWTSDEPSGKTELSQKAPSYAERPKAKKESIEEESMSINLLDPFHKVSNLMSDDKSTTAKAKSAKKKAAPKKKAAAKKTAAKKTTSRKTSTAKKAAPKKKSASKRSASSSKKSASSKRSASSKTSSSKKASPRKTAAKKSTARKASSTKKTSSSKKAAPRKAAAKKSTAKKAAPKRSAATKKKVVAKSKALSRRKSSRRSTARRAKSRSSKSRRTSRR
jgi:hypothetical protein